VPSGDYLLLAVARIGGEPVMGEIMDLQVPDSLEKRLKTLKGLPLTQQDIEGLTDSGEIGGRKLRFFSNMSQPTAST
jgi:hypothetical protein